MFFIGIFGIENKQKLIGTIDDFACKSCKHNHAKVIKYYNYFHFFFIPLFKWGEKYYIVCDECESLYSISKEKGKAFEHGKDSISYWDIKSLKINTTPETCPYCNETVENKFDFCPYCGKSLHEDYKGDD